MNKNIINSLLSEINDLVVQVNEKKASIEKLKEENLKKSNMNYNKYNSKIKELDNLEQSIKSLMENKYFKYIEHIDFTDYNYIYSIDGFNVNEEIGCVIKSSDSKIHIDYLDKVISSDNKTITYIYPNGPISNLLEYCFYSSESGSPLIPSSIKVVYKDNEDNFYESHFRFYNRNNKSSFVSSFPFNPKRISKIIFKFDEEVNTYNNQCDLYSIQYSMNSEDNIILEIKNYNMLGSFTLTKQSEESFVPFGFYYSENNSDYKPMKFNDYSEALLMLENYNNFYIKIVPINDEIKINEEITIKTNELFSKNLEHSFGVYSIPSNSSSTLNNLKITFSLSSYNKLKEKLNSVSGVTIDDFVTKSENGIYILKSEYISYINDVDEEINKLKYLDDVSILETDKKYFKAYVNSKTMKIHFPSFIEEFDFFIEIQYQSNEDTIGAEYYTPYLFSLSLKG